MRVMRGMIVLAFLALAFMPRGGRAAEADMYCFTSGSTPVWQPCSTSSPLPFTGGSLTPVAGTQNITDLSSATALTVPTGATSAWICGLGVANSVGALTFWQDDGTNPTGTSGSPLSAGPQCMYYKPVSLAAIKFIIATGATLTRLTVAYYK